MSFMVFLKHQRNVDFQIRLVFYSLLHYLQSIIHSPQSSHLFKCQGTGTYTMYTLTTKNFNANIKHSSRINFILCTCMKARVLGR